jgi:hypothetical protein
VRKTFTVGSRPPAASFSVAGSKLTSTTADPGVSLAWDLDGDRAFDDATGPTARALPGEHLVGLEARDAGGDIGIAYARVTGVASAPSENLPLITPVAPIVEPVATPLALTATVKKVKLKTLLKSGLAVTVRCGTCRATVIVKRAGKQVGRASGSGGVIRVKLSASARRALKHAHSVKLTLTISAPGAKPVTKTLTVKR